MRDCLGVPHPRDWPHSALRDSSVTMPPDERLSPREIEIASAYAQGDTYQMIAARRGIAPSTVRTHLATIYRKLEVSTKLDLRTRIEAAAPTDPSTDLPPRPDKPSIAVLAFQNMSEDHGQEYFSDAIHRRHHHGAVAVSVAVHHRPQHDLHLQGVECRSAPRRGRTWRPLRPRRQRSARRRQGSGHGATDRRADGRACLVRQL